MATAARYQGVDYFRDHVSFYPEHAPSAADPTARVVCEGVEFSATAFHERLMGMGTIPAGCFREVLLG